MPRYSKLAPFNIEEKLLLAKQACIFFSPIQYEAMCITIGKTPNSQITPFSVYDFLKHLEVELSLTDPLKYQYRVKLLLDSLEHAGILNVMGQSNFVTAPNYYYFLKELTEREKKGALWLAPALGPEFLIHHYKKSLVHILGANSEGDEHAGTGLILDATTILTCAHVINDMTLYDKQIIQGVERSIAKAVTHESIDVGIIKLTEGECWPDFSIAFKNPTSTESVYTIGFPRIPLSRDPAIIIQSGEVASEYIKTIYNDEVFLYSAIARPGNSGGPIISSSGHIVGIVTHDLSYKDFSDAPFYAGIPTSIIAKGLSELSPDIKLPIETYE
ncbi:S1 family peptidase [Pseudomonas pergaminensis]